ncbi:MAG: O-antigen ligase family protein [Elusimicrobia bacterium]|nr:O-antigen ligase family protein [Elusimicrobiota bacterium]
MTASRLICFFIFLFTLTMIPSISSGYIAFGLIVVTFGYQMFRGKEKIRIDDLPLFEIFMAYVLWGLISSFFGLEVKRSLHYWKSDLLCGVFWVLYGVFSRSPKARIWALKGFAVSLLVLAVLGLLQIVMIRWFPSFNDWLVNSPIGWLRKFSMYPDPHTPRAHGPIHTLTYGEVMAIGGLFWIGSWQHRWGRLCLGALCLGALVASGSRGPALGFLSGFMVVCFCHFLFANKFPWRPVLALAIPALILFSSDDVWARFKSAFQPNKNRDRISLWRTGLKVLEDYPLTGVGVAHMKTAWPNYFQSEWKRYMASGKEDWSDVHNLYLQQAGERGLPGLAVLLLLLGALTYRTYRFMREDSKNRETHIAILGVLVAFLVMNATESAFQDTEVVFVFYMLLALGWSAADRRGAGGAPQWDG